MKGEVLQRDAARVLVREIGRVQKRFMLQRGLGSYPGGGGGYLKNKQKNYQIKIQCSVYLSW